MELILATDSAQKKSLMNKLGLAFKVVPIDGFDPSQIDLTVSPEEAAKQAATQKATIVASKMKDAYVVAHHMVVSVGGKIIQRPQNSKEVEAILDTLSGKTHKVVGAIIIMQNDKLLYEGVQVTNVEFINIEKADLQEYAKSEEPLDKVGGYTVQGRGGMFIQNIDGSFFNVAGLPLKMLVKGLSKIGLEIDSHIIDTIDLQEKSIKESFPR